jgi:ribonuclease Z
MHNHLKRYILPAAALAAAAFLSLSGVANAQEKPFSVITLGTGAPPPSMERFGPSVLVQAGEQRLLFDVGRGATQRLWQARVPFGSINAHFITHLHSDHIVGLPDLWLMGWLDSPFGRRKGPMRVIGPKGTRQLTEGLQQGYAWDLKHRGEDQKLEMDGARFAVAEIEEGIVYDEGGVRVTAFEVDHGPLLKPAFGYRIDFDGRSVVISGDTRYSENLIKHAQDATLLIHAVAMIKDELLQKSLYYRYILAHHTTPKEIGQVFAKTRPKLGALIHFVLLGDLGVTPPTLDDVAAGIREAYQEPVVFTQDMMRFEVGRTAVTSVPPSR